MMMMMRRNQVTVASPQTPNPKPKAFLEPATSKHRASKQCKCHVAQMHPGCLVVPGPQLRSTICGLGLAGPRAEGLYLQHAVFFAQVSEARASGAGLSIEGIGCRSASLEFGITVYHYSCLSSHAMKSASDYRVCG